MAEYIERKKAIDACFEGWDNNAHDCAENIRLIPAADVRPVVKSKWADNRVAFYRGCPKCGAFVSSNLDEVFLRDFPSAVGRLNFCPNCGADMREES